MPPVPVGKAAPALPEPGLKDNHKTQPVLPGGVVLGHHSSSEACRLAVVIQEALAGTRTPAAVARYYQLESQALGGLLAACQRAPSPKAIYRARMALQARLRSFNWDITFT